jgi:hypothetical protein
MKEIGIAFTISNKTKHINLSKVLKKEKWIYLNRIVIEPKNENTILFPELKLIRTKTDQITDQICSTKIELKKVVLIKDKMLVGTNKMMSTLKQEAVNCQETKLELILTNPLELASNSLFNAYFEYSSPEHECLMPEQKITIENFKSFTLFKN